MIAKRFVTAVALAASFLTLSACQGSVDDVMAPNAPLPAKLVQEIKAKGMGENSPILVKLYKEESTLEVWKQKTNGEYALLKSYPICAWSGKLGPKIREGDRQAPEGFYTITPAQLNPNSNYHLAFNIGYPNAFDRVHGRSGAELMVHGACSSSGCYAMDDAQISEIYALAGHAFQGGQRAFQIEALPFRMTPENMAKHRNSEHYAFWKNLKQGTDYFEVTHQVPQVGVCEKRYIFNPQLADGQRLDPAGPCPQTTTPAFVASKSAADEVKEQQVASALDPSEFAVASTFTYTTGAPITPEAYAAEQHRRKGFDRDGKRVEREKTSIFDGLLN